MAAENPRKEHITKVVAAPATAPATAPAPAPAPDPGMRWQEEPLTREERWQGEPWTREEVDPIGFSSITQWEAFLRNHPAARTIAEAEGFLVGAKGGGRRKHRKSKKGKSKKGKSKKRKSRKRSKTRRRRR